MEYVKKKNTIVSICSASPADSDVMDESGGKTLPPPYVVLENIVTLFRSTNVMLSKNVETLIDIHVTQVTAKFDALGFKSAVDLCVSTQLSENLRKPTENLKTRVNPMGT